MFHYSQGGLPSAKAVSAIPSFENALMTVTPGCGRSYPRREGRERPSLPEAMHEVSVLPPRSTLLMRIPSLLHRLQTETTTCSFLPAQTPRIHQQPIAAGRLPKPHTPLDDLWSIKAALDMVSWVK